MAPWPNKVMDDNSIFASLNVVMLGYFCLVFLPRWRGTPHITLVLALAYSVLYAVLLVNRVLAAPLPEGGGFDSLDGVVALFTDRHVILAGWTHYIAFDLMIARHIVMDSFRSGVPHLAIVWTIPLTLFAGPAGLGAYYAAKFLWRQMTKDAALLILYCGATFFSLFMVFWVLILPASWRLGFSKSYDDRVHQTFSNLEKDGTLSVPASVALKYAGHRAVQFTHTLPSVVWAASVPIQLHPGIRKHYRKLHRITGYSFFAAGLLMTIGFAVIDWRGLDYLHHDFPSVPLEESTSAIGFQRVPIIALARGLMALFALFAVLALRSAICRDFAAHRTWVLRHIGVGLWIAPQRMYAMSCKATTPREQKANFGDGIFVGLLITMLSSELAIRLLRSPSSKKLQDEPLTDDKLKRA